MIIVLINNIMINFVHDKTYKLYIYIYIYVVKKW